VALTAAVLYAALFARALAAGSARWEANLADWLYWHSERSQDAMDHLLRLGEKGGPLFIALFVLGLAAARRWPASLLILVGAGGAAMLGLAAKATTGALSSQAGDFPSGHATGSAGLAAAFVVLLWDHPRRRLILLAGIACVLVYGLMLVATVWHSPSEVVGGWLLALAWVCGVWLGARTVSRVGAPRAATPELRGARWDSRQQRGLEPRA
jgi:membrane-associated phospholipid phosphatase